MSNRTEVEDRLLAAMTYIERCYDQVAHLYRQASGSSKYPTNVSQDLAQLIAMREDGFKIPYVTEPGHVVEGVISVHQVSGRGTILHCELKRTACRTGDDQLMGRHIIHEGKIYVITGVESGTSHRNTVGLVVRPVEDYGVPSHTRAVNHMVQSLGMVRRRSSDPEMQFLEPRPARDTFARGVFDKAWEEQKKRPWTIQHDYADLELRVFAQALKQMGLAEWFAELTELVCFPDVDDLNYIRDQLKEHINDKRVSFLREPEAPPRGTEGEPEDDHDR